MRKEKPLTRYLEGEEAFKLWQKGRNKWNDWIDDNPDVVVDFSGTKFPANAHLPFWGPCTDFSDFRFPKGNCKVSFRDAVFPFGARFTGADFGSGVVDFIGASFGNFPVDFQFCRFGEAAFFTALKEVEGCRSFSFDFAKFDGRFVFASNEKLGCPLDFRRAIIKHDVIVRDIDCDLVFRDRPSWKSVLQAYWSGMSHGAEPYSPWLNRAADREDSQRFRKLKEMAVANRDHAKALDFHVQEIRSKRGWETKPWQDIAQFFYWLWGDYGRSVRRPLAWLAGLIAVFAAIILNQRTSFENSAFEAYCIATTYSISNMLAFLPSGKTARLQAEQALFAGEVPTLVLMLSNIQSILAVILLFMLGLGLRNLFRV